MNRVKIIGVGNEDRHDDGIGIVIARKLKNMVQQEIKVIEARREAVELLDSWKDAEKVIMIDAANGFEKTGKIYRFHVNNEPFPCDFSNYSTHTFSLNQVIELARNLNELPTELVIYGIQGMNFNIGRGLSEELNESIKKVVSLIEKELVRKAES